MLGWKYVHAEEESQKYKIGKFILETKRVVRAAGWDAADDDVEDDVGGAKADASGEEEIQFDSQDEDECEDLFSGLWTPTLARKRRSRKAW